MYCPKCGAEIAPAPLCRECGTSLTAATSGTGKRMERWTKPGIAVLVILLIAFLFNTMVAMASNPSLVSLLIGVTAILPIWGVILVVAEIASLIVSHKWLKFKDIQRHDSAVLSDEGLSPPAVHEQHPVLSEAPKHGVEKGLGFVGFRRNPLAAGIVAGLIAFLVFAFIYWGLAPARSQLDPTPEPPTFESIVPPDVDVQALRERQLQEVEALYTSYSTELDEQFQEQKTALHQKYQSQTTGWVYPTTGDYMSTEEWLEYLALKRQYEQAKANYAALNQQAIDDVNEYWDILGTIQAEEATYLEMMSGITNEQGHITDVSKIEDILPTTQQYRADLQTLKATISTPPDGETAEQEAERQHTIAQIGEQVSGITSLESDYLKQEEFKSQGWLAQKWDLSTQAFRNLYRALETAPLWAVIGGCSLIVMILMAAFFGLAGKSFLQRLLAKLSQYS